MTQKTDVVLRMRKGAEVVDRHRFPVVYQTYTEAADEIERLRKDNNKLREIMWNIIYETKCALEEESDD